MILCLTFVLEFPRTDIIEFIGNFCSHTYTIKIEQTQRMHFAYLSSQ